MSEREPDEHSTRTTALQLAAIIANHWHDAGHSEVETWIEPTGHYGNPGKAVAWGVKSNLVNGLPPEKWKEMRYGTTEGDHHAESGRHLG